MPNLFTVITDSPHAACHAGFQAAAACQALLHLLIIFSFDAAASDTEVLSIGFLSLLQTPISYLLQ